MTAGDLAVVLAAVLCTLGFAALVMVLTRVLDALRTLRSEVASLREDNAASAGSFHCPGQTRTRP